MANIRLDDLDFEEILKKDISGTDTNTYISMPKKYKGRKVMVIILKDE